MEYDLTPKIAPFLDPHLLLKMLVFFEQDEVYPKEEILKGRLALLAKTSMVGYQQELQRELPDFGSTEEELAQKKQKLLETLNKMQECKFIELFSPENQDELQSLVEGGNWNMEYLSTHKGVTGEDVDTLYDYAKFYFECGDYGRAGDLLRYFRSLNTDIAKDVSALWGKLAVAIVLPDSWEEAASDLVELSELIEDPRVSPDPLKSLQQRTWLAHWALFVYFHLPNGAEKLLDMLLGERFIRAIQINAPWILRYLSVAAILTKHRIQELVKVVEGETGIYSDPIIEFIRSLYVQFDFEAAEAQIQLCGGVLKSDYFISGTEDLKNLADEFLLTAKLSVAETFCKIHSTIDIGMMAEKLEKTNEESERWIVNLIRNEKLDARIDSAKNQVVVQSKTPSTYQQLYEKTRSLSLRASVLASQLERAKSQQVL